VGLGLVALLFVPLLASELQSGFAEARGVLAYFAGGGGTRDTNPLFAIAFTLYRIVGWPLVGSVLDAPAAAAVALGLTIAGAAFALRLVPPPQRTAIRWFVGLLIWSTLALALAAPSLLQIVVGLPNDHYHAFLDPVVILLLAIPAGILFERATAGWRAAGQRLAGQRPAGRRPARALGATVVGLVVIVTFTTELLRLPPRVDPDGGWPAMQAAGARVVSEADDGTMYLVGLPAFKLPDALGFPIVHANGTILPGSPLQTTGATASTRSIVVVCDHLFDGPMGAACGGPAEDAWLAQLHADAGSTFALKDRFDASPRTVVSLYEASRE